MPTLQSLLAKQEYSGDPLIMGVVNVTPDSFSDGGEHFEKGAARGRIDELFRECAEIIDIGAESTRPGAIPVPAEVQLSRARDAIQYAVGLNMVVSVDTSDPDVAQEAALLGASVINDVSCLRNGDRLAQVAMKSNMALIITHARSPMRTISEVPPAAPVSPASSACRDEAYAYGDVVSEVRGEWTVAAHLAKRAGMRAQDVFFDPGLGFNKSSEHSYELIARLDEFRTIGHAIVVGPSRKSFLASPVKSEPKRRVGGTIAACLACASRGASVLRVHDVLEIRQALAVERCIREMMSKMSKSPWRTT